MMANYPNFQQELGPCSLFLGYIEMLFAHFSKNPDMYGYVGKLLWQHLNLWLLSNPREKSLICVGISWCEYLRVQHTDPNLAYSKEITWKCFFYGKGLQLNSCKGSYYVFFLYQVGVLGRGLRFLGWLDGWFFGEGWLIGGGGGADHGWAALWTL